MFIDGIAYLLASDESGARWVARYEPSEMDEMFSLGQQIDLAAGKAAVVASKLGAVRYVDMVGAAQMVD